MTKTEELNQTMRVCADLWWLYGLTRDRKYLEAMVPIQERRTEILSAKLDPKDDNDD